MHPAVFELKKRLQERYRDRLERFLVFGSYARGEHTPESDIDVFVTLKGDVTSAEENDIYNIAFQIDLEYEVLFDMKVFSEKEITHSIIGATPFVETVLQEGIPM